MTWLLVFLGMVALDFVWAKWAGAITPLSMANWTVPITVISGYLNVSYVHDIKLLIPACAGGWVGTYLAKRYC